MGVIFLGLLLLSLVSADEVTVGSTVAYQVHSFNDIREWPQLYSKGVSYMKIDPQYADNSFCKDQTRANASDLRGCLLLNHDSLSSDRNNYNTTSDMLDFISDINYENWFRDINTTVYISLCFKGCGSEVCPCDHSESSNNWLSLVDEFVNNANQVVADNALNVKFLLDGDANPGIATSPCLAQRWRPWEAVYITSDQPNKAFYDDNEEFGWDRLVCLNEAQKNWEFAVENDYGKFKNKTFPYMVWEPSDQETILSDVDMYINHSIIDNENIHEGGMRFAINIDPAQFEVYIASRSGRSWDEVIVPNAMTDGNKDSDDEVIPSHPTLSVVESTSEHYAFIGILLWNQESSSNSGGVQYELFGFNSTSSDSMVFLGQGVVNDFEQGDTIKDQSFFISSFPSNSDDDDILVSISAITLLTNSSQLLQQAIYVLTTMGDGTISMTQQSMNEDILLYYNIYGVSLSVVKCNHDSYDMCNALIWSPITMEDDQCALYLHITDISSNTDVVPSTCLVNLTSYDIDDDDSFIISTQNMSIAAVSTSSDSSYNFSVAVMYDVDGIVYGASSIASSDVQTKMEVCVNCHHFIGASTGLTSNASPLKLYVGSNPSVSLKVNKDGQVSVFGVSSFGYCTNSESHNKNAHIGLCDQIPEVNSGGQYLNYYYGTFSAWTTSLMSASDSSTGFAGSPCSHLIASGMFGMGSTPSTSMWIHGAGNTTDGGSWQAAVAYVGVADSSTDPASCGVADSSPNTIRIASWHMAQNYFSDVPISNT